jgi:preprotein translocase subunit YajC
MGTQSSTVTMVLYMVVFIGIMYMFMIRPQQKQAKQRQAMLNSLRANDKIITTGGIYGKIKKVKDDSVIVQIADKVEIEVARAGIASVENREIVVEKDKKADKKDKDEKVETNQVEEKPEENKAVGTTEN